MADRSDQTNFIGDVITNGCYITIRPGTWKKLDDDALWVSRGDERLSEVQRHGNIVQRIRKRSVTTNGGIFVDVNRVPNGCQSGIVNGRLKPEIVISAGHSITITIKNTSAAIGDRSGQSDVSGEVNSQFILTLTGTTRRRKPCVGVKQRITLSRNTNEVVGSRPVRIGGHRDFNIGVRTEEVIIGSDQFQTLGIRILQEQRKTRIETRRFCQTSRKRLCFQNSVLPNFNLIQVDIQRLTLLKIVDVNPISRPREGQLCTLRNVPSAATRIRQGPTSVGRALWQVVSIPQSQRMPDLMHCNIKEKPPKNIPLWASEINRVHHHLCRYAKRFNGRCPNPIRPGAPWRKSVATDKSSPCDRQITNQQLHPIGFGLDEVNSHDLTIDFQDLAKTRFLIGVHFVVDRLPLGIHTIGLITKERVSDLGNFIVLVAIFTIPEMTLTSNFDITMTRLINASRIINHGCQTTAGIHDRLLQYERPAFIRWIDRCNHVGIGA